MLKVLINKWVMIVLFMSSTLLTYAQQEVLYTQYMFNTMAINPAYAGSRDVLSITALGRFQWMGIDGSPKTQSITLDMPFRNEKMGLGVIGYNDEIGVSSNSGLQFAYSYRMKLGAKSTLSMGLSPSFALISNRLSDVKNLRDEEQIFQTNISKMYFNTGVGLYLSNDKSYIGFSVPRIIESKLQAGGDSLTVLGKLKRHYFLAMGFVVGKGGFKVKPSLLTRVTPGMPMSIDGNLNFWFRDRISIGFSGRKSQAAFDSEAVFDAVVGMVEIQLNQQLRFGYAYDYTNTRLNNKYGESFGQKLISTPTHELLLRYEFGYGKSKILSTRYF
ncbi:MAG: PorP/SprF family type IX secretion system membrane protein [Leadbetterella sp.]